MLTLLCAVFGTAWGETETYIHTFTKADFNITTSGSNEVFDGLEQTRVLDSKIWTISLVPMNADGLVYIANNNKGLQIGSGSRPAKSIALSSSAFDGTIQSITVNTSGASGTDAQLTVKVGGTQYSNTQTLVTSATDYTFTGNNSGKIELLWTQNSTKAIYVKTIQITYGSTSTATETTTTITATNFNTDLANGTTAGQLTASVTANGTAISGATVTWSSSNTDVATVDANGNVTLEAAGTTNIVASYAGVENQYKPSHDSYNLTVTNSAFVADPTFDPASGAAVAAGSNVTITAEEGCTLSYTVNGVAQTSTTNTASVTINEATTIVAKAVRGSYESAEVTATYTIIVPDPDAPTGGTWVWTNASGLSSGDLVVLVDQNKSKAMSNNKGTSSPTGITVTLSEGNTTISSVVDETMYWVVTVTEGTYQFKKLGTNSYLYCNDSNTGVKVGTGENNVFSINNDFLYNNATSRYVGYYAEKNDWRCYKLSNGQIQSNIEDTQFAFYKHDAGGTTLQDPELTISDVTLNLTETANLSLTTLSDGEITFTYSSDGIASITKEDENYVVTALSPGTITVTATQNSTSTYSAKIVTFTVTVNVNRPEGALFYDSFSNVNGSGGRDGGFGQSGNVAIYTASGGWLSDEKDWVFNANAQGVINYQVGAAQCIKLGTGTEDRFATTREIDLQGNTNVTLTFNAAGWQSETANFVVSASSGTLTGDVTFSPASETWTSYTVNIQGASSPLTITFTGHRGFIDDVLVMPAAPIWMTYCSESNLNFTNNEDVTAYIVYGYSEDSHQALLSKIDQVPAGIGIMVKAADGTSSVSGIFTPDYVTNNVATDDDYSGIVLTDNFLVGVTTSTPLAETGYMTYDNEDNVACYNFVLAKKDGKVGFYKSSGNGNIGANKAYLQLPQFLFAEGSANGISFAIDGEETAIKNVNTRTNSDDAWYTLQGVRVAQPNQSGIYIRNGQKVVVK